MGNLSSLNVQLEVILTFGQGEGRICSFFFGQVSLNLWILTSDHLHSQK